MFAKRLLASLSIAGGLLSGCYYPPPPPQVQWVETSVGRAATVGGPVREPRVVSRVNPVATSSAGFAQARLVIGGNGAVRTVDILSASDDAAARSAKDALSQWKFVPTIIDGSPAQIVHELKITFKQP